MLPFLMVFNKQTFVFKSISHSHCASSHHFNISLYNNENMDTKKKLCNWIFFHFNHSSNLTKKRSSFRMFESRMMIMVFKLLNFKMLHILQNVLNCRNVYILLSELCFLCIYFDFFTSPMTLAKHDIIFKHSKSIIWSDFVMNECFMLSTKYKIRMALSLYRFYSLTSENKTMNEIIKYTK